VILCVIPVTVKSDNSPEPTTGACSKEICAISLLFITKGEPTLGVNVLVCLVTTKVQSNPERVSVLSGIEVGQFQPQYSQYPSLKEAPQRVQLGTGICNPSLKN